MTQKREKEVTELKVPETVPMCTPMPPISAPPSQSTIARSPDSSDLEVSVASPARTSSDCLPRGPDLEPQPRSGTKRLREVNRCSGSGCRKKIGLMGFTCRCGDVFCSQHRYSDRHDCNYDYKAAAREAIARDNPVVRAAKLFKV